MKTSILLRSIATLAFLMVVGMSSFAQNVATPSAGAGNMDNATSDYVTIGSRVSYYSATDAIIQAMTTAGSMKQSIFNWTVTTAADVVVPAASILNYTGAAAQAYDNFRANAAGTGFFDNEISILWDATYTAGTQYKVKTMERSVTLSASIVGCDGGVVERPVFVLARPTVAFPIAEGGGCSVAPGSSYYVPLNVTGLGVWTITYTVSYNGGAASAPATYNLPAVATVATDVNVIALSTAVNLQAGTPTAATDGLKIDLPAAQYGYYDIVVTDINDRISKKAMTALAASPAAGSFRIYVNPVPTTSPVQHLKNL